ncbi:hypothetical protein DFH08DRAFT_799745 [Mycena albidolilacea]|uniref:Uncharacterized protein n=1 Tax=Mycena albidolilacea TaxID=1033008 RepID=A0AAD7AM43_9AGAR|nr:hypothetical protein DFH08DRAFT_799745 [Mycena albidolilacea]
MPANGEIKPLSEIPILYAEFNSRHHILRRQDRETFVLTDPHSTPPNAEAVITAKTIQLFILHCQRMQDPTKDTLYNPVAYRKVAEDMNDFDMSPIKWAYYVEEDQWTYWNIDGDVPTLSAFMVRDRDIEAPIPESMVLVPRDRFESATEAMWCRETGRHRSIARSQAEKQAREPKAFRDITSPASRLALEEKRQSMQSAYETRVRTLSHATSVRAPSATPTMSGSVAGDGNQVMEEAMGL